jgi:hypothetical protein
MSDDLQRPVLKRQARSSAPFDPAALAASSDLEAGARQFDVPEREREQTVSAPVKRSKQSVEQEPQKTARITFYLTPEDARAFRVRLAQDGKSMTSVLNEAVEAYIKGRFQKP